MAVAVQAPTIFAAPGQDGSLVELKDRYENFIGGEWVAPRSGKYRENVTPATAEAFCEVADSGPEDVELALDAAHAAKDAWGRRSPAERAAVLDAIADAIEENLEMLAVAESWENGKPVRETLAADHAAGDRSLPLLRRGRARRGGLDLGDRREDLRLPLPRAARRGRADHPVQLPAADGGMEAGPGARGRQLHGDQACEPDAMVDAEAGRGDRGRRSARCHQHRQRLRRRGRARARLQQADRQDRASPARRSPGG